MSSSPLESILTEDQNILGEREREDFAYLLGMFSRNKSSSIRQNLRFERVVSREDVLNRIRSAAKRLGTHPPRIRENKVRIYDQTLMRALHTAFEKQFMSYVPDDANRISFMRGFFDCSNAEPSQNGNTLSYRLTCINANDLNKILLTLFELGVYPLVRGSMAEISGFPNMYQVHALNLDQDPDNQEVIRRFLKENDLKEPHILQTYYNVRKRAISASRVREPISSVSLAQEFGLHRGTIYPWIEDLVPTSDSTAPTPPKRPHIVRVYEALLEYFKLPNVYLAEYPTCRNEKIFIPINNNLYLVPFSQQQRYMELYDVPHFDEDCANHLQEELGYFLDDLSLGSKRKYRSDLEFTIENQVILDLKFRSGSSGARCWNHKIAKGSDFPEELSATELRIAARIAAKEAEDAKDDAFFKTYSKRPK